jgi:hypothetical protein
MLVLAYRIALPVFFLAFSGGAYAQDGQHGHGHDAWHAQFYAKLLRNDTKTSCCNMSDCRPTMSRMSGDHYEVLVDGEWTPVPQRTIQNITAPDAGAHVCAPKQQGSGKGVLYCVVLPPET